MTHARLIACTQIMPEVQEEIGGSTPEHLLSYCARVSNPSNQTNFNTAAKLLKYCIDKKHWSVFEMVNVVFEINTSRTITRQILRHGIGLRFQEFSQRYADVTQLEFLESECRIQDPNNRQKSYITDNQQLIDGWKAWQGYVKETALKAYRWALGNDLGKEIARDVLPEGLTPSRLYVNGYVRSWIHYCLVRMGNGTQAEHQVIAKEIWALLRDLLPFMKDIEWEELVLTKAEIKELLELLKTDPTNIEKSPLYQKLEMFVE